MPIQTRQRITGLLLALCLNAAFIAMFVWQARPRTDDALESDSTDPFEKPGSATAQSFDKAVVGKAIKVAMAERKALEDTQKFVKSGPGRTQYEQFAADPDEATIPYCYRGDAMKHAPPVLELGSLKIGLGSALVLPFLAKAIVTGKCRMK